MRLALRVAFPPGILFLMPSRARALLTCMITLHLLATPASAAAQSDEIAAKKKAGEAAIAAGRFDEAASLYAEIVRAVPNEAGMHVSLGLAHGMAGRAG